MEKMKACPCKNAPVIRHETVGQKFYWAECVCGAYSGKSATSQEAAIAAWNRRAGEGE